MTAFEKIRKLKVPVSVKYILPDSKQAGGEELVSWVHIPPEMVKQIINIVRSEK